MSAVTGKELMETQQQNSELRNQFVDLQNTIDSLKQENSFNKQNIKSEMDDIENKLKNEAIQQRVQLEEEALFLQKKVQQLEEALVNATDSIQKKEDLFRSEIGELRKRCLSAETKNETLVQSLPQTTSPLLHQVSFIIFICPFINLFFIFFKY